MTPGRKVPRRKDSRRAGTHAKRNALKRREVRRDGRL